jgi:hypothetical protein
MYSTSAILSVANTTEFNFRHWLDSGVIGDAALSEAANNSSMFESAVYWGAGSESRVVLAPEPISKMQIKLAEVLLATRILCIVPSGRGLQVSNRAILDTRLGQRLHQLLKGQSTTALAWGPTAGFVNFLDQLRTTVESRLTSEYAAVGSDRLADHLNNKIEQKPTLIQSLGDRGHLNLPQYVAVRDCGSVELISKYAELFPDGAIVKSAVGWGGRASFRIKSTGARTTRAASLASLSRHFAVQRAFFEFGCVVERQLVGRVVREFCVDVYIDASGNVFAWPSRTLVVGRHSIGMVVGREAVNAEIASKLRGRAYRIADRLQQLGYRGWFDIDFLQVGRKIFVLEINARRTGGTALIEIAQHSLGASWAKECAVQSRDRLSVHSRIRTQELVEYIFDLSRKFRSDGVLVFPLHLRSLSCEDPADRHFGYVALSHTKRVCIKVDQLIRNFVS